MLPRAPYFPAVFWKGGIIVAAFALAVDEAVEVAAAAVVVEDVAEAVGVAVVVEGVVEAVGAGVGAGTTGVGTTGVDAVTPLRGILIDLVALEAAFSLNNREYHSCKVAFSFT